MDDCTNHRFADDIHLFITKRFFGKLIEKCDTALSIPSDNGTVGIYHQFFVFCLAFPQRFLYSVSLCECFFKL